MHPIHLRLGYNRVHQMHRQDSIYCECNVAVRKSEQTKKKKKTNGPKETMYINVSKKCMCIHNKIYADRC